MDIEKRRASQRKAQAKYYQANKEKHIAAVRLRERNMVEWFQGYKSTLGCMSCDESHPATLQFHHVIGTDHDWNPGDLIHKACWGKERILKELTENCVVLCANCHAKVHHEHRNA